jgi:hypothetical protein
MTPQDCNDYTAVAVTPRGGLRVRVPRYLYQYVVLAGQALGLAGVGYLWLVILLSW